MKNVRLYFMVFIGIVLSDSQLPNYAGELNCHREDISKLIDFFSDSDKISRASSQADFGMFGSTHDLYMAIERGKRLLTQIYANPECRYDAERLKERIQGVWSLCINLDCRTKSVANKTSQLSCIANCLSAGSGSGCTVACDESYENRMKEVERDRELEEKERESFFKNLHR